MVVVVVLALIVFGVVLAFPIGAFMVKGFPAPAPASVSTVSTQYQEWSSQIQAVGSLTADKGADLSVEVAGIVDEVNFDSGRDVKAGAQLIRLIDADDRAKLNTLQANANLAQLNFTRDQRQREANLISQAAFDLTGATLKSAQAQVAEQAAIVAKKTLRAPFAGHLGIRNVNVGQYINAGATIVTLQALDPINFDFSLPQQVLQQIQVGQSLNVKVDTYPNQTFVGKIATINPKVDPATRNVTVRAQLPNPDHKLLPGMFATAEITTGMPQRYLTLPQTAITFNPYGNAVFLVQHKTDNGKTSSVVQQTVVTTGRTRGDQIAVLSGIKQGDEVVSAGQMKLQNGATVAVNNAIQPTNEPNPHPTER
jgi:membrane fusion protein (multidrug efflux system)